MAQVQAIQVATRSAMAGDTVQVTIALVEPAPEGGLTLLTYADLAEFVELPSEITIPEGHRSITFLAHILYPEVAVSLTFLVMQDGVEHYDTISVSPASVLPNIVRPDGILDADWEIIKTKAIPTLRNLKDILERL